MVTENVVLSFRADGTRVIERDVKAIGTTAKAADKSVDELTMSFQDFGTTLKSVTAIERNFLRVQEQSIAVSRGASANLQKNTATLRAAAIRTETLANSQRRSSVEQARLTRLRQNAASVNRGATQSIRANNNQLRLSRIRAGAAADAQARLATRLRRTGREATTASRLLGFLARGLLVISGAQIARGIVRQADSFQQLQNRLRVVVEGETQLVEVSRQLLEISQATRSSLDANIDLFSRLSIATKQLGTSREDLLQITKSLNQAIILSGATAQEAQAGLIQLSQGLSSGALRGDELRSVLEQLPVVADVIAKQLNVTRGELRALGREGVITADVIIDGFKAAEQQLSDQFQKTVPTLAQSFTVLANSVKNFLGTLPALTTTLGELGRVVREFAESVDALTPQQLARFFQPIEDVGDAAQNRANRLGIAANLAGGEGFRRPDRTASERAGDVIQGRKEQIALREAEAASLKEITALLDQERTAIGLVGVERDKAILQQQLENNLRQTTGLVVDDELEASKANAAAIVEEVDALTRRRTILEAIQGPAMENNRNLAAATQLREDGVISLEEFNKFLEENLGLRQQEVAVSEAANRALQNAGGTAGDFLIALNGIDEALQSGNIGLEEANLQMNQLQASSVKADDALGGVAAAFLAVDTSARALGFEIGNNLVGFIDDASGALADFAITGFRDVEGLKAAFSDLFTNLGQQLIQLAIRFAILRAIQGALGGGVPAGTGEASIGGLLGGVAGLAGKQAGGPVRAGQTVIAGERGPEPFTPTVGGRFEPASSMAAAAEPPVIQINNLTDPDDVEAQINSNPLVQAAIVNIVRQNSQELELLQR